MQAYGNAQKAHMQVEVVVAVGQGAWSVMGQLAGGRHRQQKVYYQVMTNGWW